MPSIPPPGLHEAAERLIELTARAWKIRPASPQALARRAPHGYVPRRALRRLRTASDMGFSAACPSA